MSQIGGYGLDEAQKPDEGHEEVVEDVDGAGGVEATDGEAGEEDDG